MLRGTSDQQNTIGRIAAMEPLESRQFLSASTFDTVAMTGPVIEYHLHQPAAVSQPARPGAKVARKVAAPKAQPSAKPTLAGKWTGTAIIDKGNVVVPMSADLKQQVGKIVSGTITMGAVMGSKPIRSNMIIDPYNNCRMVLAGNGSVGGLTAAASPDGNSIIGRWTWNVKGLWVTGTFKLTKIAK